MSRERNQVTEFAGRTPKVEGKGMSSISTEALVSLEDREPALLRQREPECGNALIWPLLRWPVAKALLELERASFQPSGPPRTSGASYRRLLAALTPNPFHSRRLRAHVDALFWVSGTTTTASASGYTDWLVGENSESLGARAAVVQDKALARGVAGAARPRFAKTFSSEDMLVRAMLHTRRHPLSEAARARVRAYVADIFGLLGIAVSPARQESVAVEVMGRLARVPAMRREVDRLLARTTPQAVFMQMAAYGERSALIADMHERGIRVIEHQHGFISPEHQSYNFGKAMFSPELSSTLPDTLLTFGDYWGRGLRFPGEIVAVGKAHLDRLAQSAPALDNRPKRVVVASSVRERERVEKLTLTLRDALPTDWQVSFRPHPSERATVADLYRGLVNQERVSFDLEDDVYVSLAAARAVLGFSSTVLFEALAFDCDVAVIDSDVADLVDDGTLFGKRVSTDASIRALAKRFVSGEASTVSTATRDALWMPQATGNFEQFVKVVL